MALLTLGNNLGLPRIWIMASFNRGLRNVRSQRLNRIAEKTMLDRILHSKHTHTVKSAADQNPEAELW